MTLYVIMKEIWKGKLLKKATCSVGFEHTTSGLVGCRSDYCVTTTAEDKWFQIIGGQKEITKMSVKGNRLRHWLMSLEITPLNQLMKLSTNILETLVLLTDESVVAGIEPTTI